MALVRTRTVNGELRGEVPWKEESGAGDPGIWERWIGRRNSRVVMETLLKTAWLVAEQGIMLSRWIKQTSTEHEWSEDCSVSEV